MPRQKNKKQKHHKTTHPTIQKHKKRSHEDYGCPATTQTRTQQKRREKARLQGVDKKKKKNIKATGFNSKHLTRGQIRIYKENAAKLNNTRKKQTQTNITKKWKPSSNEEKHTKKATKQKLLIPLASPSTEVYLCP